MKQAFWIDSERFTLTDILTISPVDRQIRRWFPSIQTVYSSENSEERYRARMIPTGGLKERDTFLFWVAPLQFACLASLNSRAFVVERFIPHFFCYPIGYVCVVQNCIFYRYKVVWSSLNCCSIGSNRELIYLTPVPLVLSSPIDGVP